MRLHKTTPWRAITAVSLLACALVVPGSTAAAPSDASDLDAAPQRRVDTPTTPSLWDQPAPPAPVVINAPAPKQPAEPEQVKSANPLWAIPLATLTTTRDRPIFSPSRRPPPPAVAAAPPPSAPPPPKPPGVERPQLSLVGTIAGDEESFGIFVDQTTKVALRLKIGEDFQGWKLRAVQGREVTLEHGEKTTVLSLPSSDKSVAQPVAIQAENTGALPERLPQGGAKH